MTAIATAIAIDSSVSVEAKPIDSIVSFGVKAIEISVSFGVKSIEIIVSFNAKSIESSVSLEAKTIDRSASFEANSHAPSKTVANSALAYLLDPEKKWLKVRAAVRFPEALPPLSRPKTHGLLAER